MELSHADLSDLANTAISAATEAGQMVAQSRPQTVEYKEGGDSLASQVVTEIDRAAEDIIVDTLRPTLARYELGLLTEETADDGGRLTADYFWCVDPIDGTLPFIEGIPGYAVSIALVRRDGFPKIGVIYDPVESMTVHAIDGAGVFRNGSPWAERSPSPSLSPGGGQVISVFANRSFLEDDQYGAVMDALESLADDMGLAGVSVDATAGAVMNACRSLANPPACYFTFPKAEGGPSLWDHAATACVFNEAGAVATDFHGAPLDLNRADSTFMNHRGAVYATHEVLAERIRSM